VGAFEGRGGDRLSRVSRGIGFGGRAGGTMDRGRWVALEAVVYKKKKLESMFRVGKENVR